MAILYSRLHHVDGNNDDILYPETNDESVQVESNNASLPTGINTVRDLIDNLGALAFEDSIEINAASITVPGLVQLSNETNDTTIENEAATVKAVSEVNGSAVHINGDEEVIGVKNFSSGTINMDGAAFNYDSATNILHIGVPSSSE